MKKIERTIMNHPECAALRVTEQYMVIQSSSHPLEGYSVKHDGDKAIHCDLRKCQNAIHGKKECWHLARVNEELAFDRLQRKSDELEEVKALVEAQEVLRKPADMLNAPLNGDKVFSLWR
jgi:hypothetical protein